MTLSILTPMNHFFEQEIKSVSLQTIDGRIVIMPRYAPYVTGLLPGIANIVTADGNTMQANLNGGFAEVIDNKVAILTDDASWVE